MIRKNAKIAAYILAGVTAVCAVPMRGGASSVSSMLPAAGLALIMEEGSSQQEVKESTKSAAANEKKEKQDNLVQSFAKEVSGNNKKETETVETETEIKTVLETESSKAEKKEDSRESKLLIENIKNENAGDGDKEKEAEDKEEEEGSADETVRTARDIKSEIDEKEQFEKLSDEEKEFTKLVIAKVNNYVNIRNMPGEEGEVIGKLYDKSVGNFIEEEDGWYKIKSGSVTGYVKGEFCVTGKAAVDLAKEVGTRVATVNTTTLKVRESASMDAPVLGLVPIEEELSVLDETDGWVKVDIEEGYGYVSAEYVDLRTDFVKAESKAEEAARLKKEEEAKKAAKEAARKAEEKVAKERAEKAKNTEKQSESSSGSKQETHYVPSSGGGIGSAVVDYAMQFVGNPYVYGGSSLTNGTDCSGFVMSVYKNFGVSLPHSSSADRSQGYDVGGIANAQPGDIVCYSGHVGIYAGNGQIVHASTSKTGIIVSNANYRNILAVRRIF